MDCSLPGFSVHGILQARILEWVTISFSRGSSWPKDWTWVSRIGGKRFNLWICICQSQSPNLSLPTRARVLHVEGSPVANDKNHLVETRLTWNVCRKPGGSKTFKTLAWCSENDIYGIYKTEIILITEPIYFLLKCWSIEKKTGDRPKFTERWNLKRLKFILLFESI